jgi:CubicO group peptidase (beta-lactamase class C family)
MAGLGALAAAPKPTAEAIAVVRAAVEPAARAFVADPRSAGLSLGVLMGGEAFTYHFGVLDRGQAAPPDDRTLYPIASITKTFTGSLLAQAAAEKKLRLDADIRTYLSGLYPGLEFQGQPILVHQLVTHRSGLPFVLPDASPEKANEVLRGQTKKAFLEHLRGVTLGTAPGATFRYSNAGAQLAGYLLEDIYGVSYEELVARQITRPLGMPDTVITLTAEQRARLAKGYDGEGRVVPEIPDEFQGAGALKSTVVDMLKYAGWHLAESHPAVTLSHAPTFTECNYSAGLNWQMLTVGGRRLIWQEGHVPGYLSYCVLAPELGLGIVLLTNAEDAQSSARAAGLINKVLSSLDSRAPSLP